MTLLQTIIRPLIYPLLKAQRQAGREQGRAETHQRYQEWIQRLRDAGVKLNDDIPPPPYHPRQ